MTFCLESALFPVHCDEHTFVYAGRGKAGESSCSPPSGGGASPGLTPTSRRQPQGTRRDELTGLGGASTPDRDQAPLLADVISFDGQRLGLFFQLGLLEDLARAAVGLIRQTRTH